MGAVGSLVDELLELPIALLLPPTSSSRWLELLPRGLRRRELRVERRIHEGKFQRALSFIAGASGLLAGLEVTLQHYRGSYNQRIMYSPVILSVPLFLAGVGGAFSRRIARTVLPIASWVMLLDGLVGFGFHVRGIARKPGGYRLPVTNIVMGPPIFAPLLLGVGGLLGVVASRLRREDDPALAPFALGRSRKRTQRARNDGLQLVLSAATGVSAILNGFESLYSHYKNGFRYRVQWTPVVLSPLIALTSLGAIVHEKTARRALPMVSLLAIAAGGVGFYFHARGVARRPGGMTMPLYNFVYGPPALAPLLYAATGFLGLLASQLRRAHS